MFIFCGGLLTPEDLAAIKLCPDELKGHEFVAPADLPSYLPPQLARRVQQSTTVADGDQTLYLENQQIPY